jgi:hypothetical protein
MNLLSCCSSAACASPAGRPLGRACMAPKSKRGKGKGEKKKKDEKGDCFNLASTNYSLFETACMVDTIVRAFNLCFLVVF